MYIDPRSVHHLVWEVVDNSVDEATGFCDEINARTTTIHVIDNGRHRARHRKETR
jgi:DNA gyrase/topoisomerase IV subunit B